MSEIMKMPFPFRIELVDKNLPVIKDQARSLANCDQAELLSLGQSIAVCQLQPVGLHLSFGQLAVIWGHRRILASRMIPEITHISAAIFDQPISESHFLLMRATENFQRLDLTPFEQYRTCKELMVVNPTWQLKDLAENLKRDPSMLTRIMSLDRCCDQVKKVAETGLLSAAEWYAISKQVTEEAQLAVLAKKLAGATRDDLERERRKSRNGHANSVKLSRVKAPLPSGVEVVISGKELGLDDVIEALGELLKDAKKAHDSNWHVRNWAAVLRDKAKARARDE